MRTTMTLLVAGALLLLGGCKKNEFDKELDRARAQAAGQAGATNNAAGAGVPAGSTDKSAALGAVAAAAAQKAGLSAGNFESAAARPYGATGCARGEIAKLDVLVCRYGSTDQASAAKTKLRSFVGSATTGAVRIRDAIALVVADRAKADLRGKGINKLLKGFGDSS